MLDCIELAMGCVCVWKRAIIEMGGWLGCDAYLSYEISSVFLCLSVSVSLSPFVDDRNAHDAFFFSFVVQSVSCVYE